MAEEKLEENASSGHKLGQLVGDWFQDCFVVPILTEIADDLGLYLDHRQKKRPARTGSIIWKDEDGNEVDYDFVMELSGSDQKIGIPVAFFECFWRRGSRHSKDKARDDSGKLTPMRQTYPTSRFLGIIAAGEFTNPARELVRSRNIDLFYLPKQKIVDCFQKSGLVMDYVDSASEGVKAQIVKEFEIQLTAETKSAAVKGLRNLMTNTVIDGYRDRVRAALSALPQEVRIIGERKSVPHIFETVKSAAEFLQATELKFDFSESSDRYIYEVTYSDGFEFARQNLTLETLRSLHGDISALDAHMRKISSRLNNRPTT